jgi:hypothetical protein
MANKVSPDLLPVVSQTISYNQKTVKICIKYTKNNLYVAWFPIIVERKQKHIGKENEYERINGKIP